MTNKYLVKLAEEEEKKPGFVETTVRGARANIRSWGEGLAGSILGGAAGAAATAVAHRKAPAHILQRKALAGSVVGGGVGAFIGEQHGTGKSAYNQRNEWHKKASDNKYLEKVAKFLSSDTEKDLINTGTIGLAGGVTGAITDRILNPGKTGGSAKAFMVGTGLGLVGDYAALRANKRINNYIDESHKK